MIGSESNFFVRVVYLIFLMFWEIGSVGIVIGGIIVVGGKIDNGVWDILSLLDLNPRVLHSIPWAENTLRLPSHWIPCPRVPSHSAKPLALWSVVEVCSNIMITRSLIIMHRILNNLWLWLPSHSSNTLTTTLNPLDCSISTSHRASLTPRPLLPPQHLHLPLQAPTGSPRLSSLSTRFRRSPSHSYQVNQPMRSLSWLLHFRLRHGSGDLWVGVTLSAGAAGWLCFGGRWQCGDRKQGSLCGFVKDGCCLVCLAALLGQTLLFRIVKSTFTHVNILFWFIKIDFKL